MKNCWELRGCGREAGGDKVLELGECVASREKLGHSCWAIAGTLCGGEVQGSVKEKSGNCLVCDVYKIYNRLTGTTGRSIPVHFPEEERRYRDLMLDR